MSALHPTWQDQWAPALMDADLRKAITADKRFATRIEQDLLDEMLHCPADLAVLDSDGADIADTAAQFDEDLLLNAGLYWCAPVLPATLRPLSDLPDVAVTRDRLRMVLAGRTHRAPSHVTVPRTVADVYAAGELCVAVWVRFQPDMQAARLALRMDCALQDVRTDPLVDGVRYTAVRAALDVQHEGAT